MEKYILYTDGGARGNPGIAGAGVVITDAQGAVLREAHKALGVMTNNEAEYHGAILGFETLKREFGGRLAGAKIEHRLDSELVCKQLRGEYRIKEPRLQALYAELRGTVGDLWSQIDFIHVRREQNKEADRLANVAMDGQV